MMRPKAYNIDTDRFDELFDNFKSELGHYEVGFYTSQDMA